MFDLCRSLFVWVLVNAMNFRDRTRTAFSHSSCPSSSKKLLDKIFPMKNQNGQGFLKSYGTPARDCMIESSLLSESLVYIDQHYRRAFCLGKKSITWLTEQQNGGNAPYWSSVVTSAIGTGTVIASLSGSVSSITSSDLNCSCNRIQEMVTIFDNTLT